MTRMTHRAPNRRITSAKAFFAVLAAVTIGASGLAYASNDARRGRIIATQSADTSPTSNSPSTIADVPVSTPTTSASTSSAPRAAAPPVRDRAKSTSDANLLFEDDFDGRAGALPDTAKWIDYSVCINPAAWWGMIRCGDDETLDGSGNLVIPAGPDYGTGLQTAGKFGFVYGTASAWMKLPKEVGYWPAFWMVNPHNAGQSDRLTGEIDMIEGYTTWHDKYHVGTHSWNGPAPWGASPVGLNDGLCADGVDLTASFHKYSARVEPNKVTFLFDDKQCGQAITPEHASVKGKPWPWGPSSMNPNLLILNLAVGGADGQQKPATAPAKLLVDRVEVRGL